MEESSLDTATPNRVEVLLNSWADLPQDERATFFRSLDHDDAEDFFLSLDVHDQALLLNHFSRAERRLWIRFLAPDDAADVIQASTEEVRGELLSLVDESVRREINALLSYNEDEAGGLMNPRFARVRPDMLVAEAIRYVRKQALSKVDHVHYVYVLDSNQVLQGILSLRQLFVSPPEKRINEVMEQELVTIPDEMDQENVSQIFRNHRFVALPVVDSSKRMQGIVTLDDILDVSQEEATEDIQKVGGMEALDAPYPSVTIWQMVMKRAPWLLILFIGEMFTTSTMAHFEEEIAKAVVLSLFIPLIISSGGNSGSQATTLIIRSMALGELRLRDWWWVFGRELLTGLVLGLAISVVGFFRIWIWPIIFPNAVALYTVHYTYVALAVGISLVGTVMFGTLTGSMLPFILRKIGLDPASASAPFVATLVDVLGLVIYFTSARILLSGILL